MIKFEWKQIINDGDHYKTFRAKVIGGWLVRNVTWSHIPVHEMSSTKICESMVFVRDAAHEWEL